MGLVTRKPVFGVSDQVRLNPICSATETRKKIKISLLPSLCMILSNRWITKVLARQWGCAGWSAPLLFASTEDRFSLINAQMIKQNLTLVIIFAHKRSHYNVSGYRCVSDCRSRGCEFDPGPILSWRLIVKWFLRSFSSLPLIHSRRVVVSYKRKYVHKLLVIRLFKPAQEKVWLGELTVPPWP